PRGSADIVTHFKRGRYARRINPPDNSRRVCVAGVNRNTERPEAVRGTPSAVAPVMAVATHFNARDNQTFVRFVEIDLLCQLAAADIGISISKHIEITVRRSFLMPVKGKHTVKIDNRVSRINLEIRVL